MGSLSPFFRESTNAEDDKDLCARRIFRAAIGSETSAAKLLSSSARKSFSLKSTCRKSESGLVRQTARGDALAPHAAPIKFHSLGEHTPGFIAHRYASAEFYYKFEIITNS